MAHGRAVRDACALARARGVRVGTPVVHARRLCPTLLVVPVEAVDARAPSARLLDALADLSPVVEPDGPDAAYADLAGVSACAAARAAPHALAAVAHALALPPPLAGLGPCRNAARALAEGGGLPPERLHEADARWLWPEDARVTLRLHRLGLTTFGAAAAVGEGALVYQFGRIGRLLHRRALGRDFTPIRPLYPPPRADATLDLSEFPLDDRARLEAALCHLAGEAARQLRALGSYGRRVVLIAAMEGARERRGEWVPPAPVQAEDDLRAATRRLFARMPRPDAPVAGLRLFVEDLGVPGAEAAVTTRDLFGGRERDTRAAARALRRTLSARYGPQALQTLGERPQGVRDRWRALVRDQEDPHGGAGPPPP